MKNPKLDVDKEGRAYVWLLFINDTKRWELRGILTSEPFAKKCSLALRRDAEMRPYCSKAKARIEKVEVDHCYAQSSFDTSMFGLGLE